MDIRFDGKKALVTGAGKGIGRALSKALLEGGAKTYALSRTQADLDSLKQECPGMNTVCVDLADWDATRKAVQDIGPVDLLVNNAGVAIAQSFMDMTPDALDESFNINVKAAANVSQVVAKGMIERGQGGSIVNISSISSIKADANLAPYRASKAALDHLTRAMAVELGPHQVRVNSINPTFVKTKMSNDVLKTHPNRLTWMTNRTPQLKVAEIDDIVRPVLYLLSDKSDMINGTTICVDGGYTIC